jgi:hypothetical protein
MTTPTGRMTDWDVTWNSIALGTFNEVDPSKLKMTLEPITRGTTGKTILGHMVTGLEGTLTVQCMDVTSTLINDLQPWQTAGEIIPSTPNQDLYSYAQVLTLHPHDVAAATHTEDLNFIKAVPISVIQLKRDGGKQDMLIAEFQLYPDRAQIVGTPPKVVYGYVGPIP